MSKFKILPGFWSKSKVHAKGSLDLQKAISEILADFKVPIDNACCSDNTVGQPVRVSEGVVETFNGTAWVAAAVSVIVSVPSTASSTGTAGQIAYDATHIYVCVATNTWVRASLATW